MSPTDVPAEWVVFGARTSLAIDIAEIVWRRGDVLAAAIDNLPSDGEVDAQLVPLIDSTNIPATLLSASTVIPQSTPGYRYACARDALAAGFTRFPPLIDPTAVVARTATLADGSVVSAGALVAARTAIDEFALINRGASVGHHVTIHAYASVGPSAVLAGYVTVERGAFIGAGAVLAPEVTIGANAVVGAGAVVIADVDANSVVVGNPARVVREDVPGHGGVGVP